MPNLKVFRTQRLTGTRNNHNIIYWNMLLSNVDIYHISHPTRNSSKANAQHPT